MSVCTVAQGTGSNADTGVCPAPPGVRGLDLGLRALSVAPVPSSAEEPGVPPRAPGHTASADLRPPSSTTLWAAWAPAASKARDTAVSAPLPSSARDTAALTFSQGHPQLSSAFHGLSRAQPCPGPRPQRGHTGNPVRSPGQALSPGALAGPGALEPGRGQRPHGQDPGVQRPAPCPLQSAGARHPGGAGLPCPPRSVPPLDPAAAAP